MTFLEGIYGRRPAARLTAPPRKRTHDDGPGRATPGARVAVLTCELSHRHTAQHTQLTTAAQYRRMAAFGMCANIFSNHIYYWGDQHASTTVG